MAPFGGTLNNRCRIIIGTPKGTIILTTTQVVLRLRAMGIFEDQGLRAFGGVRF